MLLVLMSRPGYRSVLLRSGSPGSALEWSEAQLLAMGYRVVTRFEAASWLDGRALVG